MKNIHACVCALSIFGGCLVSPVQAQYQSGGSGASPVLKGCASGLAPALNDRSSSTSCGAAASATGQFAGSLWTGVIMGDGRIAKGDNWLLPGTVDRTDPLVAKIKVNFKKLFPTKPVCLATPAVLNQIQNSKPISTGNTSAAQTTIYAPNVFAPDINLANLVCSAGQ